MYKAGQSFSHQLPEKWQKGELLGRGSFGKVFLLIDLSDRASKSYVVKELLIPMIESSRDKLLKELKSETEILLYLQHHDRIVPYYGHQITQSVADLFFGYMPLGSVSRYYSEHGPLSEHKCMLYTKQILEGLKYLHDRHIVHGDIKGANILLQNDSHLRLADFGLSKFLDAACKTNVDWAGTLRWMAPEIINPALSDGIKYEADIWSVGCTMVEMLTSDVPYKEIENDTLLIFHINSGNPPKLPKQTARNFSKFFKSFFQLDPSDRKSVDKILSQINFILKWFSVDGEYTQIPYYGAVAQSLIIKNNDSVGMHSRL
ncbi:hypothetical protein Btru_064883, partial [Bulinus truncatus]